jgi:integrase
MLWPSYNREEVEMSKRKHQRRSAGQVGLVRPSYVDRSGALKESRSYAARFTDHRGIARALGLGTGDSRAAEALAKTVELLVGAAASRSGLDRDLSERVRAMPPKLRATLARWDLVPSAMAGLSLALSDLLAEYRQHLAESSEPKHVDLEVGRCEDLFARCGARLLVDVEARTVERVLREARASKEWSASTRNYVAGAARRFTAWAFERQLVHVDPLAPVAAVAVKPEDRTFNRRPLSVDEARRLLRAAASGPKLDGVDGSTRQLVYRVALELGLRRGELAGLRVGDLDLADLDRATVLVRGAISKNGRSATLPLRRSLAEALQARTRLSTPSAPVFALRKHWRAGEAVKADCERAGIEAVGSAGVVDLHSLRHTFATWTQEAPHRITIDLMRHTPLGVTAGYQHTDAETLRPWIVKLLPSLAEAEAVATQVGAESDAARVAAGAEAFAAVLHRVLHEPATYNRTRLHSKPRSLGLGGRGSGETGRRSGLKIRSPQGRGGSSPPFPTRTSPR